MQTWDQIGEFLGGKISSSSGGTGGGGEDDEKNAITCEWTFFECPISILKVKTCLNLLVRL